MRLKPLPRSITQPLSLVIVVSWVAVMAIVISRAMHASSTTLATDLARYGSSAVWRGVYYRGEKIGFTVSQTVARDDGFELDEDGRLQMSLLGATTPATIRTRALVDRDFLLKSFEFSLDPGTGPLAITGQVADRHLTLTITSQSGSRTEERDLPERPMLSLNLSRILAHGGLVAGARHQLSVFDPATLRNAPVTVEVGQRELVRGGGSAIPAFRVDMTFSGLHTTSWVTDTGEVVREESPLGLITVRESADTAQAMAVSRRLQTDLFEAAAVVPAMTQRIDDTRDVTRLLMQFDGADLTPLEIDGVGQSLNGNLVEIVDPRGLTAGPADPAAPRFLEPEPLIESDAPEIIAEAEAAVRGVTGARARAERLTRYVNALLDKKPTVSLPSAREVLRTKVGDCNEHTALYVAMARALGIPSRIAVGLVYIHGGFYYHAWPEVYLDEGGGRGLWLPVDPTLNEFPADAMHVRLARGGLDRQAVILPLIGQLKITVLDLELVPGAIRTLVGRQPLDLGALAVPLSRQQSCCSCGAKAAQRPGR